jgi:hypothetical protein
MASLASIADPSDDARALRRLHAATGWIAMVLFLSSGMWMRLGHPGIDAPDPAHRLLFRSRHMYILAASLVHLVLAGYVRWSRVPWRRRAQLIASALLTAAVALLVYAFLSEWRSADLRGWPSSFGLYALFAGVALHYLCGDRARVAGASLTPSAAKPSPAPASRAEETRGRS